MALTEISQIILTTVSEYYQIPQSALLSSNKQRDIMNAKHMMRALLRVITKAPWYKVSGQFGLTMLVAKRSYDFIVNSTRENIQYDFIVLLNDIKEKQLHERAKISVTSSITNR